MSDDYGDPETDPEAAMADEILRDLLSDVPPDAVTDPDQASMMIEVAMATAWPDGTPPSIDELAQDPDFDAVMAIDVAADDEVSAVPDGYDAPDGGDETDDGGQDVADELADDTDWDASDGSDEQG